MPSASGLDYAAVFERTLIGIFRHTIDGRIIAANLACARILGFDSVEELTAHGSIDYVNPSDLQMIAAALPDVGTLPNLEVSLRRRDGNVVWVSQNVTLESVDGVQVIDGVIIDVTEQRTTAERIEYHAQHDPLTALPNRGLFLDRLSVALARARRMKRSLAVLFIDLDHFDLLNKTFGPGVGDRVLKGIATRLSETLRIEDSLARFGTDEFTLFLADFGDDENCAVIAQRVLETISAPFNFNDRELSVNASIGLALFPEDGQDAESLLKNSATAMYRAKDVGRNTYQLFQPVLNARAFERMFLISNLHRALERNEFVIHYQPEVNIQTGRIECIEALLRWRHPDLGLIEPAEFLLAAEEANLAPRIGDWVVREACRQARSWAESGIQGMRIAVNLSGRQFLEPQLIASLERALDESRIAPASLELEISETSLRDSNRSMFALAGLRDLGVSLALDNFGTGRSSFTDMKRMPLNAIKIDASFVRNVTHRPDDAAIVEAMITMARGLDMRVVAEGVETKEQLGFLRERKCHEMQGYFFGRPLPALELQGMLKLQH